MQNYAVYLPAVLLGYLLGCSNMAFYLSRIKGIDLRSAGSGNLGASNALILMGRREAALVCLHDIGKAALAVLLVRHFLPGGETVALAAGTAAVFGHIFPFYLRFKGGKGFASYIGMAAAVNWKFTLALLVIALAAALLTDYIVVATVTTVVATPLFQLYHHRSLLPALIPALASAVILYLHRENYRRIAAGTEIGIRRADRGDDRIPPKK